MVLRIEDAESVRRSSALGDGCAIVADGGGVLGDCVSGRFVAGTRLSGVIVRSGCWGLLLSSLGDPRVWLARSCVTLVQLLTTLGELWRWLFIGRTAIHHETPPRTGVPLALKHSPLLAELGTR